jgi:hypothetical protein
MLAHGNRILRCLAALAAVLAATGAAGAFRGDTKWVVAAPSVSYRLVEGSYLVDDCRACARPAIKAEIRGAFQLVPTGRDPLFATYGVRALRFASDSSGAAYSGSGSGRYRQGGEVAIVEEMSLTLRINGRSGIALASGLVTPLARPPWIEIDLVETSPAGQSQFYRVHVVAVPWPEVWFSASQPFTSSVATIGRVGDGDLLSVTGALVRRNGELTSGLGIMPPAPDLGLDAAGVPASATATSCRSPLPELWFSVEEDAWSETLGQLHHGDLLSDAGRVVRPFGELIQPFCPMPPIGDLGLDAVAIAPDGSLIFSIEEGFFSECLGVPISPSDLLDEDGSVFRRGRDLLGNFRISSPIVGDLGIDAAHIFPDGEVWFSTGADFIDERYGPVGNGDLLSDTGRIVARNRDLLAPFGPVEDLADFGLDALHVVSRPADFDECGSLVQGVECPLLATDTGKRYVLSTSGRFKVGARVRVKGEVRRRCVSICMQGDGCIEVRAIDACPDRYRP